MIDALPEPPAFFAAPLETTMQDDADANGWRPPDYDGLVSAAEAGAFEPEDLGVCIAAESEFRCAAHNTSGARGLTQMMPTTLASLGWRQGNAFFDIVDGDFCRAPLRVQLDAAYRYFQSWRARFRLARWRSRAQLFLANFLPADLPFAKRPGFVLAEDQGRRAAVWAQNRALDRNRDGKIVVAELEDFLLEAVTGRAREPFRVFLEGLARARMRHPMPEAMLTDRQDLGPRDVRDVRVLQAALVAHGFDPGPIDGVLGLETQGALRAFQKVAGLVADGVAGVFTWNALRPRGA